MGLDSSVGSVNMIEIITVRLLSEFKSKLYMIIVIILFWAQWLRGRELNLCLSASTGTEVRFSLLVFFTY